MLQVGGGDIKEFKHRTDLLNESKICFRFGIPKFELKRLIKTGVFPEPNWFKKSDSQRHRREVFYWEYSVVKAFIYEYNAKKASVRKPVQKNLNRKEIRKVLEKCILKAVNNEMLSIRQICEYIQTTDLVSDSDIYLARIRNVAESLVKERRLEVISGRPKRYQAIIQQEETQSAYDDTPQEFTVNLGEESL